MVTLVDVLACGTQTDYIRININSGFDVIYYNICMISESGTYLGKKKAK